MSKYPYFRFYPGDFLNDVKEWTPAEKGHHITLLSYQWLEGSLPKDLNRLEMISPGVSEVWENIKHKYKLIDGRLINNRLEKTRDEFKAFSKSQSEKSKKRWESSQTDPESMPGDMPRDTQRDTTGDMPEVCQSKVKSQKTKDKDQKSNNTPSSAVLSVMSFLPDYKLSFPSMTIPRMLEDVYKQFGVKALRYMLEEISKVKDLKKRTSPHYVKAMIRNAPLLGIKNGENDEQGHEVKEWTREEAISYCDKNGVRMDISFATRKDKSGEPERFEDGKAKFFLVTPQEMISSFAGGAQA